MRLIHRLGLAARSNAAGAGYWRAKAGLIAGRVASIGRAG